MILIFLTLCILAMPAFHLSVYAAELPLPEHNISVGFDLQEHRLTATSLISLPAGFGIELQLGGLDVAEITVNGQQTTADKDENVLQVPATAATQEIRIEFTKQCPAAAAGLNLVDPSGIVLTDNWHPAADRDMLFSLTATIPADFSAVSEADEIITSSASAGSNRKQAIFRFSHPLQAIHLAAGPYEVEEEKFSNDKILASYFFHEDRELAASYRQKARGYLERYEALIGPYPYERFSVVENRLPTGFAMPTFTLLGQAVVRLPFITDTSLGHEVLHEWFGNSVGVDYQSGNWCEGLTSYLADYTFASEAGHAREYRKEQLVKYESYVSPDNALPLDKFTGAADNTPIAKAVRAVGYAKGAMFFHMLKNVVGEEAFHAALRDFFSRMRYQRAGWADLLASFENTAKMDLGFFFHQWLTRTDIPELSVGHLQVREVAGRPLLSFQLRQNNDPPYQLTVPFAIRTGDEVISKSATIAGAATAVEVPLAKTPSELIIDGDYDLMRKLGQEELPPTWSRFEGSGAKIAIVAAADDRYEPFIELLKGMDCRILQEKEVTDSDLTAGSLIFLGTEGRVSRSLFARPDHPKSGVTVDVRNNPLQPAQTAVLVTAASAAEAAKVVAKLSHYGKYSYLHFEDGRNTAKEIQETDAGLRYSLVNMPEGVSSRAARPFADIVSELLASRVIYAGETHTNYEDHLLQLHIIRSLYERDPHLAIGMEMFSRASQAALDDYVERRINEKTFLKESNYFKQWGFDYRLYRDILKFARRYSVPVIGLNLEKQIVSNTFKTGGRKILEQDQKDDLVPDRDLDVPGYRQSLALVYQQHAKAGHAPAGGQFSGFLQAQALWDETMAESVADYLEANPDARMVVIAGRGHTIKDMGIPPRVARRLPVAQAVVFNTDGSDIDPDAADFLFFSPPQSLPPMPLLGVVLTETAKEGARVIDLSPKGQAEKAGIRKNDIITAIDDEPVQVVDDVRILMLFKEKSTSVRLRIKRPHRFFPDEELEITVPLTIRRSPHSS